MAQWSQGGVQWQGGGSVVARWQRAGDEDTMGSWWWWSHGVVVAHDDIVARWMEECVLIPE